MRNKKKVGVGPAFFKMSKTKQTKAGELRAKNDSDIVEELAAAERKLFQLRSQTAGSSRQDSKLTELKKARREVARIKTVLMEKQREALMSKYEKKKLVPVDLRKKQERSIRLALSPKFANKMSVREKRRFRFLRPKKFILKQ